MRKKKAKRLSAVAELQANIRYIGDEPFWPEWTVLSKEQELNALNWYSTMFDAEQARDIIVQYLEDTYQDQAKIIKEIDSMWVPKTVAWIIRINQRGGIFADEKGAFIDQKLAEAVRHWKAPAEKVVKANVKDYVTEKLNHLIGDIEEAIDKRDPAFNVTEYLKDEKPLIVQKIYDFYAPRYTEMLTEKPDIESANMRRDMRLHKRYMAGIVADLFLITGANQPVEKAPRKKRKVNLAIKLQHFKPGSGSIKGEVVLGAQEVWLINTRYKTVTFLRADGQNGFDIHRSAIKMYDESKSCSKRCGKAFDKVKNTITNGGKVARRKLMNEITGTVIDTKDRVNEDVVILHVER